MNFVTKSKRMRGKTQVELYCDDFKEEIYTTKCLDRGNFRDTLG